MRIRYKEITQLQQLLYLGAYIFIGSAVVSKSSASTYYVATTGSDYASGTIGNPWATPRHAAEVAVAGDTVYVRFGVYNQEVVFQNQGIKGQPITFEAYSGENPVIDLNGGWPTGNGSNLKGGGWEGAVTINASWISFSGFEVRNGTALVTGLGGGMGIFIDNASYVTVSNNVVHNIQDHGILIQGNLNVVSGNTVYSTCLSNLNGINSNIGWGSAISIDGLRNGTSTWVGNTIANNTVYNNWGEGIYAYYGVTGTTISNNLVYNNWALNIGLADSINGVINGNISYWSGAPSSMQNWGLLTVTVEDDFLDAEPFNNQIYNNMVYGGPIVSEPFHLDRTMHNTLIEFNTVVNPTGNSLIVGGNDDNLIIRNNIFDGIGVNTWYAAVALASNNYWRSASEVGANLTSPSTDVYGDASVYMWQHPGSTYPGQLDVYWFGLMPWSPAVSKATYQSNVTSDALGVARPSSPTIGALQ